MQFLILSHPVTFCLQMAPKNNFDGSGSLRSDDTVPEIEWAPHEVMNEAVKADPVQLKIVWRNVILMGVLHLASVYALFLVPSAKPLTWLFSKYDNMYPCIFAWCIDNVLPDNTWHQRLINTALRCVYRKLQCINITYLSSYLLPIQLLPYAVHYSNWDWFV